MHEERLPGQQWLAAGLGQATNQPVPVVVPPLSSLRTPFAPPRAPGAKKQREMARSTTLGVGHVPPALLWGRLLPPDHRGRGAGGIPLGTRQGIRAKAATVPTYL